MPTYIQERSCLTEYSKDSNVSCSWALSPLNTTDKVTVGEDIISSIKLPGWRRLVRLGRSATTPYTGTDTFLESTPGELRYRVYCNAVGTANDGWMYAKRTGDLSSTEVIEPNLASSAMSNIADVRARMAFVEDCRRKQGAFRGSSFMAELADTLRGIRNPARAIRKSIDEMRAVGQRRVRKARGRGSIPVTPGQFRELEKSNRRVARAINQAVSDTWLETAFGWLPLFGDITNAAKALANLDDYRHPREPCYGSATELGDLSIQMQEDGLRSGTLKFEVHDSTEFQVKYYGAVKLDVNTPNSQLAEELGFRPRDFLPAVWEWIPYSFLVDYFTNVGELIDAACLPIGNVSWVARSYRNISVRDISRMRYERLSNPVFPSNGHTKLDQLRPSATRCTKTYFSRAQYTGSLVPPLVLEIPGMRNWRKWLNMGALAGSKYLFR